MRAHTNEAGMRVMEMERRMGAREPEAGPETRSYA